MNSTANSENIYVGITITTVSDNRQVLKALSAPILLSRGVKQVSQADLSPIQYTFSSSSFLSLQDPAGFLPAGAYRVCIILYKSVEGLEAIAEDCIPLEVQPLSPPQLIIPADSSIINTSYPHFSWIPPTPQQMFTNLRYDLIVVEIFQGQSAYDAIKKNTPVYSVTGTQHPIDIYPQSNKSLDTGKVYAWKVVSKNDLAPVSESDVWTFIYKRSDSSLSKQLGGTYLLMKKNAEPSGVNVCSKNEKILKIKYNSYDTAHKQDVLLIDQKGKIVSKVTFAIEYGENFISFGSLKDLQEKQVYKVQLTDKEGSAFSTSFVVVK